MSYSKQPPLVLGDLNSMKCLTALILWPWIVISASAAQPIPLSAGPVSMMFDVDNAILRFVRVGDHEILRGINAPVRNRLWGTVDPQVGNVQLDAAEDRFELTFDVDCRERDIDFLWKGKITGDAKGQVVFTFDGVARSDFLTNRTGFCILHGPTAAGQQWIIEDVDGNKTPGHFPAFISPDQPAKNIRAISHEFAPGAWAHVRCEGDTFEMEDQRNWTDASFKTYCTPLEIPYPIKLMKGTKVSHKVHINLEGEVSKLVDQNDGHRDGVTLTLVNDPLAVKPLPGIGLQLSSQVDALSPVELVRLKALNLDHLRVTVTPSTDDLNQVIRRATVQAKALDVPLHVGLQLSENPEDELKRLVAAVKKTRPPISAWLVQASDRKKLQLARTHLSRCNGNALIGTGEDNNFTELNRNRPEEGSTHVVSFGMNPQCHAIDNLSMVECLEIQGVAVRSARQFIGDRPLMVSPITLKVQQATRDSIPGQLPSHVDFRQPTVFAAGWTLGSIKYLAEAGVDALTYYETIGWKGIMAAGPNLLLPKVFATKPNEVFAVYHVLRDIGEFAGGQVREVHSTDSLSVVGLALIGNGQMRMMVANLANQSRTLTIRGLQDGDAILHRLDSSNVESAKAAPEAFSQRRGQRISVTKQGLKINLPAHGIASIDGAG